MTRTLPGLLFIENIPAHANVSFHISEMKGAQMKTEKCTESIHLKEIVEHLWKMCVFFPVVGSDNSLVAVVNVTLQSAAYLTTQTGKRGTPPVWFSKYNNTLLAKA